LIVRLIVGLALDDAGFAEIANCVVPVTATFNVPEEDPSVFVSPRYCALNECVPTIGRKLDADAAVTVMFPVVPPVTGTGLPSAAPSTTNWTFPVGVPPVTVELRVMLPVEATLVVDTVTCVTVAVLVLPPPLPPPQPRVKLNTHAKPIPSAERYRLRLGSTSSKKAIKPVIALNVHQPPLPEGATGRSDAWKFCVSGKFMAVVAEDGPATLMDSVPVPFAPPPGTAMLKAPQVTPGTVVPQVIATPAFVNPPVGVSVTVDVPLLPAVAVAADPPKVKLPVCTVATFTVIAGAVEVA
jgi:hypothetical protein